MWHDQVKWFTCRKYSILSFQYDLLVHFKSYILIQTTLQYNIRFKRYDQFFEFLNNVKHRSLSPLLAYNSKSILATSDSFPLIMSHILTDLQTQLAVDVLSYYHNISRCNKVWGTIYFMAQRYCFLFWKIMFWLFFFKNFHKAIYSLRLGCNIFLQILSIYGGFRHDTLVKR